jgi:hypothetical protein
MAPCPGRKPGICYQFFPANPRASHQTASRMLTWYVRAVNVLLRADVGDLPLTDQEFLEESFGRGFLQNHTGLIDAARMEFQQRKRDASGPLKKMTMEEVTAFRAGEAFRSVVEALIKSGDVPSEATGITMEDVLGGCFKRLPDGSWLPWVKYRAPRFSNSAWLLAQGRHSYTDLGLALAPTGLHLTLLAPADGQELIKGPGGIRRWVSELEFKGTGKPPLRWQVPLNFIVNPASPERLWALLQSYRIYFRTIVLETSAMAALPSQIRQATVRLHRFLKATCPTTQTRYWHLPTIGTEQREAMDLFRETDSTDANLVTVLTRSAALECPHCMAFVTISTRPGTGTPIGSYATCRCGTTTPIGSLLADRARSEAAWSWMPQSKYDLT